MARDKSNHKRKVEVSVYAAHIFPYSIRKYSVASRGERRGEIVEKHCFAYG